MCSLQRGFANEFLKQYVFSFLFRYLFYFYPCRCACAHICGGAHKSQKRRARAPEAGLTGVCARNPTLVLGESNKCS